MNDYFNEDTELLFDLFEKEKEVQIVLNDLSEAISSLEAYATICNEIKAAGGVTPSLERMFGENFSSAASMEAESNTQKEGWIKRVWTKIKEIFEKVLAWFKSFFQNGDKMIKRLKEIINKRSEFKYPISCPVWGREVKYLNVIKDLYQFSEHASDKKVLLRFAMKEEDAKNEAEFNAIKGRLASQLNDIFDKDAVMTDRKQEIVGAQALQEGCESLITCFEVLRKIRENFDKMKETFKNDHLAMTSAAADMFKYDGPAYMKMQHIIQFLTSFTTRVSTALLRSCNLLIQACKKGEPFIIKPEDQKLLA